MKLRYSVDGNNQVLIHLPKREKPLAVPGRFSRAQNNRLIYWLNQPVGWRKVYHLPHKITFAGRWQLNQNYDLELLLDETKEQFRGNRLVIKGKIFSVEGDNLIFEVISRTVTSNSYGTPSVSRKTISERAGSRLLCISLAGKAISGRSAGECPVSIYLLKLSGFWQANASNQLCFFVEKKATPDILTLKCAWQINQNQEIIYRYEKIDLKRRDKTTNTFIFQGHWQIDSAKQLTYNIENSSHSLFSFRGQLETPNLYPQEKLIKYRIGIGRSQVGKGKEKIISLYGTWKFEKNLGISFLMDYRQNRIQAMEFGAEVNLTKSNEAVFSLTNKQGKPLGIDITFTHKFLEKNAAQIFLRLKKLTKESGIEAGLRIPF